MSSVIGHRISYRASGGLVLVSVLVAYLSARVTISPVTLLLLSPVTILLSALLSIAADLYISFQLQLKHGGRVERGAGHPSQPTISHSTATSFRPVPPLIFTSPAAWSVTQTRASWEHSLPSLPRPPWPSTSPSLSSSLNDLLSLISRDFIQSWYSRISDSPAFPAAVEGTVRYALVAIATRAAGVDWSEVLVNRLLPLVTLHISTFQTAELVLRGQHLTPLTESAELDLFLARQYAASLPSGKLHPAVDVASLNSKPAEEAWLGKLMGGIVGLVLPEREGESGAVRVVVREVVACAVLVPIVETLSDSDFYNRIIDEKVS